MRRFLLVACMLVTFLALTGCTSIVAPPKVRGPSTVIVGEQLTFVLDGTDPLNAHEYCIDFGDGTAIEWKSKTKWKHAYVVPGKFDVRGRERCPLGAFITDWTKKPHGVVISEVIKEPNE